MSVGYSDASLGKEYDYDSVDLKYHTFSLSCGISQVENNNGGAVAIIIHQYMSMSVK